MKRKQRRNITFMADKAKKLNLIFRPHFKTHQSATIARWFREVGVKQIAVSSLAMAHYFTNMIGMISILPSLTTY